ncbi:hypothetical protein CEP52_004894 [Fusarium oligoseptatum]|uniref:Uncharacterized protein n=1 Tax=Fusarium oligoseptatum TaxID=2604345 RepID=A0A428U1I5_9HYPO|nr:hypothetical protein CEP52_004894 [Fusarium oligoseptatum]
MAQSGGLLRAVLEDTPHPRLVLLSIVCIIFVLLWLRRLNISAMRKIPGPLHLKLSTATVKYHEFCLSSDGLITLAAAQSLLNQFSNAAVYSFALGNEEWEDETTWRLISGTVDEHDGSCQVHHFVDVEESLGVARVAVGHVEVKVMGDK